MFLTIKFANIYKMNVDGHNKLLQENVSFNNQKMTTPQSQLIWKPKNSRKTESKTKIKKHSSDRHICRTYAKAIVVGPTNVTVSAMLRLKPHRSPIALKRPDR